MSLDLTKPVQTRDGRTVEILSTNSPGQRPIIVAVNIGRGREALAFLPTGHRCEPEMESDFDLINVPAASAEKDR